jgi:hypothetical protein
MRKIVNRINDTYLSQRFARQGEFAELVKNLFEINCRKYGLNKRELQLNVNKFYKPNKHHYSLFDKPGGCRVFRNSLL